MSAQAIEAIQHLDPGVGRAEWVRIGAAAKAAGVSFINFDRWSSGAGNYNERDAARMWRSLKPRSSGAAAVNAATLFFLARQSGWRPSRAEHSPRPFTSCRAEPREPSVYETLSEHGRAVWNECAPLAGVAFDYLRARCCAIPPADGDLRWHRALKHPSGYCGPALVGLVTDAITGEPISLHRTWINADGSKADVDPCRMLLANHRSGGGVIRLWPDESVSTGLCVAEGIETALSAALHFPPAWCVLNAGNLGKFPVLPGIDCLTIIVDNDPAGERATRDCATRWNEHAEVCVIHPSAADLNDELREAR